jgi:hypothetical protein
MAIQNQGFRKDLNLIETEDDALALNNLGGAGIADDLRIIQNNLRNISTVSYVSLNNQYFYFGSTSEFVFTNDDIVTVNTDVTVGVTTLRSDQKYYVCNSDGLTQFKLSTTPSSAGVSTILVTSVSPSSFYFIREDAVYPSNIENFIYPQIQDTTGDFDYDYGNRSLNGGFDYVRSSHENADFSITKKYKVSDDTISNEVINIEGSVVIQDPLALNTTELSLSNPKSPGVFISNTRAFSGNNNPWTNVGAALSTKSSEVSIEEIYFYNNISISGISTESSTQDQATSFTHKLPVVLNNETYYLLLKLNLTRFIPANVVQTGLIFYLDAGIPQSYPGSGTTWTDLGGSSNIGTLQGSPIYNSVNGGSIVFDGTDDTSTFGNILQLGTGSRTYSCWYKMNSTTQTDYASLISKTQNTATAYRQALGFQTNGNFRVLFRGASNVNYDLDTTNPNIDLNWHYLVWVIDRNLNSSLYQDNVLLNSRNISAISGQNFQLNRPLRIGSYNTSGNISTFFFNGNIAQVSVYNRALTEAEISQNFNALRGRFGI